jgi:hypothetical protein
VSGVADKLREARALIEGGWCQNYFRKDGGLRKCFCTDGAIIEVIDSETPNQYRDACITFEAANGLQHDHTSIWQWNDAPERTQADVLAAFDKAIALAEEQSA